MTERITKLRNAVFYPVYENGQATNKWQLIGYQPRGRAARKLRVIVEGMASSARTTKDALGRATGVVGGES